MLWTAMFVLVGAVVMRTLGAEGLDTGTLDEALPRLRESRLVATVSLFGSALPGVYFTLAEGLSGTTLGKRVVRLEVVDPGGRPPGVQAAFLRNAWNFAFLVPGVLAGLPLGPTAMIVLATTIALSVVNDDRQRGWHDRMADTAVVRRGD